MKHIKNLQQKQTQLNTFKQQIEILNININKLNS